MHAWSWLWVTKLSRDFCPNVLIWFVISACGGIRTDKSVSTALLSRAGLGHIGKERTSHVATTRGLPYQANGLLYPDGLFMLPPLEECLTGLTGSSTRAGTGCTDLKLICGSGAWQQPFGPNWSLLAGNKAHVCPRHEGGRGCMTKADTSRVVLPGLVSLQHRHKPGLMVADCQALTWPKIWLSKRKFCCYFIFSVVKNINNDGINFVRIWAQSWGFICEETVIDRTICR